MHRGELPDPARFGGREHRGLNTAPWMRVAGVDRFVKGFHEGRGYNRRVPRGRRTDPWLPVQGEDPPSFAPFTVDPVDPEARHNRYLHALLLDYGALAQSLDPAGRIRDYLVGVRGTDLLLGHAFVAIGRRELHATFFVLEPFRPYPLDPLSPDAGARRTGPRRRTGGPRAPG